MSRLSVEAIYVMLAHGRLSADLAGGSLADPARARVFPGPTDADLTYSTSSPRRPRARRRGPSIGVPR